MIVLEDVRENVMIVFRRRERNCHDIFLKISKKLS